MKSYPGNSNYVYERPALHELLELLEGPASKNRIEKCRKLCIVARAERWSLLDRIRVYRRRTLRGRIRKLREIFSRKG